MPAWERWSRENPGTRRGLHCTTVAGGRGGGGGEGRGFSYLLESRMTYLAGSHVLRSWPGIRLIKNFFCYLRHCGVISVQTFGSPMHPQPPGLGLLVQKL
jgi:hypothetical protein